MLKRKIPFAVKSRLAGFVNPFLHALWRPTGPGRVVRKTSGGFELTRIGRALLGSFLLVLLVFSGPFPIWAGHVGPLVADTAEPIEARKLSLQVTPSLLIKQGVYDREGTIRYFPDGDRGYQLQTLVRPYYGLFQNMEVSAEIPYLVNWVTQGGRSAQAGGIGDVLIGGKYRFFENDNKGPLPSISGIAKIKFPTGKYEKLTADQLGSDQNGNGSFEYTLGLLVSKLRGDWFFHFNLGYTLVAETTIDDTKTKPGNILFYNLALEYSITKNLTALIEINGREQGRTEQNNQMVDQSEARALSLLPALEWDISEKVFFIFGCSIPLLGKNTDFGFTPYLMFNYNF